MTKLWSHGLHFSALVGDVHQCVMCPRMSNSSRIFGLSSGTPDADLLFIGEAPGRLGADETAIPFHGDRAGENFERLIAQGGISRYECFITNAVLCNPKDDNGNNATPSKSEIANCCNFLRRQIELVQPLLIVTLGNQALQALKLVVPHSIDLSTGVRRAWRWYGRTVIPLYHPGQRAMVHRSFLNQLADYQFVTEQLRKLRKSQKKSKYVGRAGSEALQIAEALLRISGSLSYFRLHKLAYLAEYFHVREHGVRLTNSYVIRQKDGPYFTELHVTKLRKSIPSLVVHKTNGSLRLSLNEAPDLFANHKRVDDRLFAFLADVFRRYRAHSDEQLKTAVYMTTPMRAILRREKHGRENLFNAPIDFLATKRANTRFTLASS